MPIMEMTPPKGTAREQIMEMISVIEVHLQQTREILDRIEVQVKELKKEHGIQKEREEKVPVKKDSWFVPAREL